MPIEIPEDQAEFAAMRERTERAKPQFQNSVLPIYTNSLDWPEPRHLASCILLSVDGRKVLCMAAHTADEMTKGNDLYVAGRSRRMVHIAGNVAATPMPPGGRKDDHYDCAYWLIPELAAQRLGTVEFLDLSRVSDNTQLIQSTHYLALGCLVSRNKDSINHKRKSISALVSGYTGSLVAAPQLATELGISGEHHMFLHFQRRSRRADGELENTFGPTGFSGGALIALGTFTPSAPGKAQEPPAALLSGMLIEHYEEHEILLAVKIGVIMHGIRLVLEMDRAATAKE